MKISWKYCYSPCPPPFNSADVTLASLDENPKWNPGQYSALIQDKVRVVFKLLYYSFVPKVVWYRYSLPPAFCNILESVDSVSRDGPVAPIHVYAIHYEQPNISEQTKFVVIYLSTEYKNVYDNDCICQNQVCKKTAKCHSSKIVFLFPGLTLDCLDNSSWFKQIHFILCHAWH